MEGQNGQNPYEVPALMGFFFAWGLGSIQKHLVSCIVSGLCPDYLGIISMLNEHRLFCDCTCIQSDKFCMGPSEM